MPVVRGLDYLLDGVTMHLLANEIPTNSLLAALLLNTLVDVGAPATTSLIRRIFVRNFATNEFSK